MRLPAGTARRVLATVLAVLAIGALARCSRDREGVTLTAPYNDRTRLGELTAAWRNTGEERAFKGGARLKEAEVRFQYRVDVRNRERDKLFVRLAAFQLVDSDGLELGKDLVSVVECTLAAGTTEGVLSGEVWVAGSVAERASAFRVDHVCVPLGDDGRNRYREWLLKGRPQDEAGVDAEIARMAAAPPCAAQR